MPTIFPLLDFQHAGVWHISESRQKIQTGNIAPILNRITNDQSFDEDFLLLSYTVNSIICLRLRGKVPCRVKAETLSGIQC